MLKLNHIGFIDKFSIKTNENVKLFVTRLLKEFSNKQGNKGTLNNFLLKFVTICSTKRTVVSGRLFCVIFSFTR